MTLRLAIIPARGGSKRLPRKNVLPIKGAPMLTHPVRACLDCGLFDRVIVSTEDEEIAVAARIAGAETMDRPAELATDRATMADVCVELLERLNGEGYRPEIFCCVYATAVFMTAQDLQESIDLLDEPTPVDTVLGVSEFNLQPHQAMYEKEGLLTPMWPELMRRKSQDMPRVIASNGTFLWTRIDPFIMERNFPQQWMRGFEMPYLRAIDIDTEEDYSFSQKIAEMEIRSK